MLKLSKGLYFSVWRNSFTLNCIAAGRRPKFERDKVIEQETGTDVTLILRKGEDQVGKFLASSVKNWWTEDDPDIE